MTPGPVPVSCSRAARYDARRLRWNRPGRAGREERHNDGGFRPASKRYAEILMAYVEQGQGAPIVFLRRPQPARRRPATLSATVAH
jgi:hypothetical protein